MTDNEKLNVFNERHQKVGVATRKEVHKKGLLHETFHCWFVSRESGVDFIYFQIRSHLKKDFPDLLDVTAAGHLLVDETVIDGLREIKEELGIDVSINQLVSLGVIKDCIILDNFIDKEFANVFLFYGNNIMIDYFLQKEEVSGLVKAKFNSYYEFCLGEREGLRIEGFKENDEGLKESINKFIGKNEFVPHERSYFEKSVKLIKKEIEKYK
ncbi:NUDIX hydrolase [Bacillus sp. 03113]|uniref:NUDIX hydrolase n=1 Tax=Bacillus sp. 03113 TaxID=2578211 RepID=UPI0011413AAE|nr:NUDIX hydrolase [Bacillus sp. 03113]